MKNQRTVSLREEVRLAREGKITYEPDPPYVIIRDPKNFQKRMDALRRLNGLSLKKYDLEALQTGQEPHRKAKIELEKMVSVQVELPKPTHARIVKRAKKEHVPVALLIADLLSAAC